MAPEAEAGQLTGVVEWMAEAIASTGRMSRADAYSAFEFIANIALFAPLGALLRLAFPKLRWWQINALGPPTSLAIELTQPVPTLPVQNKL